MKYPAQEHFAAGNILPSEKATARIFLISPN
jgi:hypothetical protein